MAEKYQFNQSISISSVIIVSWVMLEKDIEIISISIKQHIILEFVRI